MIERRPAIDVDSDEGITPEKISGELELRNVCFSYPARSDMQVSAGDDTEGWGGGQRQGPAVCRRQSSPAVLPRISSSVWCSPPILPPQLPLPRDLSVQVFNNFSLMIPAGKTVALVGSSGSGKSTAVQLIERFYDPDSGVVLLDGIDLRQLNLHWLRSNVSGDSVSVLGKIRFP